MNLMEHRNAASQIITRLWNAVTMAETWELRMVFNWFSYFDVLVAMIAGHQTTVSAEWPTQNQQAVLRAHQADPNNLDLLIEESLCGFRDLAMSVSIMTAKRAQNQITMEEFLLESNRMLRVTEQWRAKLNSVMFEDAVTLPEAKDCPFKPAPVHRGTRWPVNYLEIDYWALLIMLKHQIALTNSTGPEETLANYAIRICERLAGIEACPDAPSGCLLAAQASIGLAALWIPNDQRYRQWVQKQLAKAEQMG